MFLPSPVHPSNDPLFFIETFVDTDKSASDVISHGIFPATALRTLPDTTRVATVRPRLPTVDFPLTQPARLPPRGRAMRRACPLLVRRTESDRRLDLDYRRPILVIFRLFDRLVNLRKVDIGILDPQFL